MAQGAAGYGVADVKTREPTVVISDVKMETLGDDQKMVIYFEKASKGMVLNKTNATMIASLYGPETEDWIGKAIKLVSAWVDFSGRQVEAVRVRPPDRATKIAPNAAARQKQPEPVGDLVGPLIGIADTGGHHRHRARQGLIRIAF